VPKLPGTPFLASKGHSSNARWLWVTCELTQRVPAAASDFGDESTSGLEIIGARMSRN